MPHNLSKEDLALWKSIIEKVKPLPREEVLHPSVPSRKKRLIVEQKSQYHSYSHTVKNAPLQPLNRQKARNHLVEARLDLHGYTQEEAYQALIKFIQINYTQQRRALLIITGKGSEGKGILKQQLPRWLETNTLRDKILAISPARLEDGGEGAYYILLRRIR